MKCFYCRQESEWLKTRTAHMVDVEGHIIIIKNVPCKECPCCGEKVYTNDVSEKLDELFQKAELALYDYSEMDYEDPKQKVYKLVKELVNENVISRVAESIVSYGETE